MVPFTLAARRALIRTNRGAEGVAMGPELGPAPSYFPRGITSKFTVRGKRVS